MTDLSADLLNAITERRADTSRLRALAEAAGRVPGWFNDETWMRVGLLDEPIDPDDKALIIALSPAVVLSLLAERDAALDGHDAGARRHVPDRRSLTQRHLCDCCQVPLPCPDLRALSALYLPPSTPPTAQDSR